MKDNVVYLDDRRRRAARPAKSELEELFRFLELDLATRGCDHSLRGTFEFLEGRGLKPERFIPWLQSCGGYCDCEVLFNVADR